MAHGAAPNPTATQVVPGKLRVPFTMLIGCLTVLALVTFWVWFFAIADYARTIAVVTWIATCILMGALILFAALIPGVVLCTRPALFALLGPDAGLPPFSSARRWPRLTGVALVWCGLGILALVTRLLVETGPVARGSFQDFSATPAIITLAIAVTPALVVLVTAFALHLFEGRPRA